jgi:8-oxo-dGTP pyrophosphatase MutT (NUDIX family)
VAKTAPVDHDLKMAISRYLRQIRAKVGSDLLVLPSVTVLPRDLSGRVLLVRRADTSEWMTIGGMVEPDEAPADAAIREAQEEVGVTVQLDGILAALGGPEFRLVYPNGDQVSYVSIVYDASVLSGSPRGDGDETDGAVWVSAEQLPTIGLSAFARAQFHRLGMI